MRAWLRRGWLGLALLPISWIYYALTALRRALYRAGMLPSTRLSVPVIVVGNIFIGGTGKTPAVIWLVESLQQAGMRPGVISRGYGSTSDQPQAVLAASDPQIVGDEPVLIAQRTGCPITVARDRVAAAQTLLAAHPEVNVIVCDDGLQHYALKRDVEIVLFDERGLGNGWLLPAGPLREPARRRRDFTLVNAGAPVPGMPADAWYLQLSGAAAQRLSDPRDSVALSALSAAQAGGHRIVAAAGIGNPARFFGMLRAAGIACEELPLPDHYGYGDNPFAARDADIILITEKDAVKCRHHAVLKHDPRLWMVPVSAQVDATLFEKILEKVRGSTPA